MAPAAVPEGPRIRAPHHPGAVADGRCAHPSDPGPADPRPASPGPRPHGPPRAVVPELALPRGYRLRAWRAADGADVLVAYRDPALRRFAAILVDDRDGAELFVGRRQGLLASGRGASWAVCEPGGRCAGNVTFSIVDPQLGTASVGYWLQPPARGQSVAAAALRTASRYVLTELGWHRVELTHATDNPSSCRVAEHAGYRWEGTLRQAMRYPQDGRWSDEHLHARLQPDRPGDPLPHGEHRRADRPGRGDRTGLADSTAQRLRAASPPSDLPGMTRGVT